MKCSIATFNLWIPLYSFSLVLFIHKCSPRVAVGTSPPFHLPAQGQKHPLSFKPLLIVLFDYVIVAIVSLRTCFWSYSGFPLFILSERPHPVIMQVLHFNEFSQDESKEPDPCLQSNKQKVPADSSLEGQKKTTEPLDQQVNRHHSKLLSFLFINCSLWL